MSASSAPPFETLLQMIAQAAPQPWYPVDFVNAMGVPKDRLDGPLDQLRLAGLIAFTPWVSGKGQGFELTPHGADVLHSPRAMAGVRRGYLPAAREVFPDEDIDPHVKGTALGRGDAVRRALLNRDRPRLTKILIIINLVVFAVGAILTRWTNEPFNSLFFGGNVKATHMVGSVTKGDILNGEWWRLLTCCFVHHGILHLAVNMYSLWVLGSLLENIWGRSRFLTIYILAGLGGSCAAIWHTTDGPGGPLAGASGAIFGLLGSYPTWLLLNRAYLPPKFVSDALRSLIWVIMINVFITFSVRSISWEAHLGGAIIGAAVAAMLNQHRFGRDPIRWIWIGAVALVPILCVGALIRARDSDARWRKAAAESAENMREIGEEGERTDFNKKLARILRTARAQSSKAMREADDYRVETPPPNRAQEKVDQLVEALSAAQGTLRQAERACEQAGPYNAQRVRGAVTAARDELAKERAVLDQLERCLQAGAAWTEDDEARLKDAAHALRLSQAAYQKIVSGDD